MARLEKWSVRVLKSKIQGMIFERTAISKQPDAVIRRDLNLLRKSNYPYFN